MGGAICLLLQLNKPFFRGAIFIASMCKISDVVRLKWLIPEILMFVAKCAPTILIVPTADLVDKSLKISEKRRIGGMNPGRYTGNQKLWTVMELLRVTYYLSRSLMVYDGMWHSLLSGETMLKLFVLKVIIKMKGKITKKRRMGLRR
ncbi:putative 2-acylglycerol O-acyltransferase [Helianthus anomalus]